MMQFCNLTAKTAKKKLLLFFLCQSWRGNILISLLRHTISLHAPVLLAITGSRLTCTAVVVNAAGWASDITWRDSDVGHTHNRYLSSTTEHLGNNVT